MTDVDLTKTLYWSITNKTVYGFLLHQKIQSNGQFDKIILINNNISFFELTGHPNRVSSIMNRSSDITKSDLDEGLHVAAESEYSKNIISNHKFRIYNV